MPSVSLPGPPRTTADRRGAHGEILLWSSDASTIHDIGTEGAAEAVRTIWTSLHGPAQSLGHVLAREGLAYALAQESPPSNHADMSAAERTIGERVT